MKTSFALVALASLVVPSAFCDVLDVGGPNPDATEISAAVALAAEGDVIRVWPGVYGAFVIDGKSLSVVPFGGGDVIVNGLIEITDLQAGQAVEIHSITGLLTDQPLLSVADCSGAVRIHNCDFRGQTSATGAGAFITNSSNVAVESSSFRGSPGVDDPPYGTFNPGSAGAFVIGSQVAFYRCSFQGGTGGSYYHCNGLICGAGGSGGPGLAAWGPGEVFSSLCIFRGGDGGPGYYTGQAGFDVFTLQGQLEVSFVASDYQSTSFGSTTTVHQLPGRARRLSGPPVVDESGPLPVEVQGAPGDRVGLFFGTAYDYQPNPLTGPLLVDVQAEFNAPAWRFLGTIPPSGVLSTSLPLRDLPAFAHVKLHLVAVTVGQGVRRYSNSLSPVVLDSAW